MRRMILIAAIALFAASSVTEAAEPVITPDGTYMFEKRDTCDLFLDVYQPAKGSKTSINGKEKPTIVFLFGGGFIRGPVQCDIIHRGECRPARSRSFEYRHFRFFSGCHHRDAGRI